MQYNYSSPVKLVLYARLQPAPILNNRYCWDGEYLGKHPEERIIYFFSSPAEV